MNEVQATAPSIPESAIEFAKDIGEAARKAGVRQFEGEYRIDRDFGAAFNNDLFSGKIKIWYHAKDGRGRPSENLTVHYEANVRHEIIKTPASHD